MKRVNQTKLSVASTFLAVTLAAIAGCSSDVSQDTTTGGSSRTRVVRLQGAGATFPAPYYKRLVAEYEQLHPDVLIDYQSIGSGGGIRAITDRTVHFAASDAPMSSSELQSAGGAGHIVEFPTCAGGVVPTYNVPNVTATLNFTGPLLADIYLGVVTRWNDEAITSLNPGVELPNLPITPVWRTDGSGTTYIFSNYLATQSADFRSTIGMGKAVQWPLGQGGKGNEGVTAVVQQTAGGIGYVEESYADHNDLPYGAVRNRDGNFIRASPETVSLAGAGAVAEIDGQLLAADIWDQPGAEAYPIAAFTYLIVYQDLSNLPDKRAAQELANFLWWAVHDGQQFAPELRYAPLAPEVVAQVEAALRTITYKGEPLEIGE